ncbi:MAG: glycosyltransferase [Clostridiales bacterium]|nr:glycosyltransferase [Clostridiales bacterium]
MKILFLENHPMLINGLPNGFRDAGCEVKISGPLTEGNVPMIIEEFNPDLLFMLGWTNETTTAKAKWIHFYSKATNIPLVYWATEDPTHTYNFTLPLIKELKPDFVFTICRGRVMYYQLLGYKSAHMDFGYYPGVHYRTAPNDEYKCDIAVVANAYPNVLKLYPHHYRITSLKNLVEPLVTAGIRIDFWGRQWAELGNMLDIDIPSSWIHNYLEYTLANQVYSSASIVLGLQNQLHQVTQRTYEIMGSGGFLLTSDTPEINRLFTPGTDLITSSSPDQTLELVKHYLEAADERNEISKQGQIAVEPHSYTNRALEALRILSEQKII